MQTPLAAPSARKEPRDSILYGRHLSVVRFCTAIAMLLITLAIFFAQDGHDRLAVEDVGSSSEFSSATPLP